MKIGVVGLGHVGLVTAACFAHVGHDVIGADVDGEKIEKLRLGSTPFFEPGLEELVSEGSSSGALRFTTSIEETVKAADVLFICVGTPSKASGEADLLQVERLAADIGRCLSTHSEYKVLVEKSTVPVKTGEKILTTVRRRAAGDCDVVSNPEFLREGSAIRDTLNPDRIVIGASSERAVEVLKEVYRPTLEKTGCPIVVTDVSTAELIKHSSNAFLATKISFINSVAEICEATGADVETVAVGMGLDPRIGSQFLKAGVGYGGSCFPKDVAAFASLAGKLGRPFHMLEAVQEMNERGPARLLDKLRNELWHLEGKRIAALGLAFKPGTDDLRDAPALKVISQLLAEGAEVVAYDPVAMSEAKQLLPDVQMADGPITAANDADAALFLTEWQEFAEVDLSELKQAMRFPIVVDGRNLFSLNEMREAGFTYLSVGRPAVRA